MPKKGPLRAFATPCQIIAITGELVTRLSSGCEALRKRSVQPLTPPMSEQITIATFLVGGIAMSLSWVEEAVAALEDAVPCVHGIAEQYAATFDGWRTFRDDASHVVDRTLREPVKRGSLNDHDSVILDPELGPGTLVVGYDHARDVLVTGTHELALGPAIKTALEIYDLVSREVNEQTRLGNIDRRPEPMRAQGDVSDLEDRK